MAGRAVRVGGGVGRRPGSVSPGRRSQPGPLTCCNAWGLGTPGTGLASRLAGLGVFYLAGLVNYSLGLINGPEHRTLSILVGIWALSAIVFQQALKFQRWSLSARFVWGTTRRGVAPDDPPCGGIWVASSLLVGYPLLIVASGLWFRVRFVWYMTGLSLASYGVLVLDAYFRRPFLLEEFQICNDRHIIFAVSLVVLAGIVAYLVGRVRALSSYYGEKL